MGILTIIPTVMLTGCSVFTMKPPEDTAVGTPRADVIALLGEPEGRTTVWTIEKDGTVLKEEVMSFWWADMIGECGNWRRLIYFKNDHVTEWEDEHRLGNYGPR